MDLKPTHLIIPIAGAVLAWKTASVDFWDASKAPILTALSVIGAGVLVRLARGLPFTNVDQFEVDEARRVSEAIKRSIRALRVLVFVILFAMAALVLAKGISDALIKMLPEWGEYTGPAVSGAVGLLITYAFVRVTSVIQGDVGLVDLQSDFFVRAVERKQAERFVKAQSSSTAPPVANPKDYGKVIQ